MSLINEALKKAQRQRHGKVSDEIPAALGGTPAAKRAEPRSAQSILFLTIGSVALIAVSVVITVVLLSRPEPAPADPAVARTSSAPPATPPPSPPMTVAPIVTSAPTPAATASVQVPPAATPLSSAPSAAVRPEPVQAAPAPIGKAEPPASPPVVSALPPPITDAPAVAATTPTPPASPAAPRPGNPDERIHAFVDALRITGVRPLGNDSRVLMNERVYRVNDIVDRTLSLRLIKVEANSLTFSDANGFTYVKFF